MMKKRKSILQLNSERKFMLTITTYEGEEEKVDTDSGIGFVVTELGNGWAVYSKQGEKERLMRVYTEKEQAIKAANIAALALHSGVSVSFRDMMNDSV